MDRVNEDDRIHLAQWPLLPLLDLRKQFVCDIGYKALRGLESVDVHERVGDLSRCHAFGIHRNDLLVNVRNVLLTLFHHLRLEG